MSMVAVLWEPGNRIGYRSIGILKGDRVIWFWIGIHDDYEQFYSCRQAPHKSQ